MNKKQVGFSLIELSVVLLLISIALTGAVGSLLKAQQLTRGAIQILDVFYRAENLINKIQLNKAQALNKESRYLISFDADSKLHTGCIGAKNCLQQLQALKDLESLQKSLSNMLTAYLVSICRDSTPNDGVYQGIDGCDNQLKSPIAIKVWWETPSSVDKAISFYAVNLIGMN